MTHPKPLNPNQLAKLTIDIAIVEPMKPRAMPV